MKDIKKDIDRKKLKREYKETPRPAGVYIVRNTANGKSLIGSSPDLPAMLNRQRFQLEMGSHPDKELQKDWNEFGPDVFEFETLDRLEPSDEHGYDQSKELMALKEMWLEKMIVSGVPLYSRSQRST